MKSKLDLKNEKEADWKRKERKIGHSRQKTVCAKAWRKTVTERCSVVAHPGHRVVYKTRTVLCAYKDAQFFFPQALPMCARLFFLWNVFSHILFVCGCAFAKNTAVCLGVTSCVTWVLWYHTSLIFSQHSYKLVLPPLISPIPSHPQQAPFPRVPSWALCLEELREAWGWLLPLREWCLGSNSGWNSELVSWFQKYHISHLDVSEAS